MTSADLWAFVREHGATGQEIGAVVFGALALLLLPVVVLDTIRKPHAEWTYRDITAPFVFIVLCAIGWFLAFGLARERYLLRPGAGRYTVGWVAEHYTQRGRHKYLCVYYVQGERWQTGEACGIADNHALPCPALGSRCYLYFAPEDPGTRRVLTQPVPDTLRRVPPLGWAKLP